MSLPTGNACCSSRAVRPPLTRQSVFGVAAIVRRHRAARRNPARAVQSAKPGWSARAIKSFSMAELEARKLKYPTTGTEALLMGILTEGEASTARPQVNRITLPSCRFVAGTSNASRYLRQHGIGLFSVREETIKLLGKADMYFFSPEHPPLTEPAQRALDWAIEEKTRQSGESGEVLAEHMLLGIWAQADSAGHQVLAAIGFSDALAKELNDSLHTTATAAAAA
eukprot:SM000087S23333  [mRNA]  locus=s87:20005:21692:- [translate_table: standard]